MGTALTDEELVVNEAPGLSPDKPSALPDEPVNGLGKLIAVPVAVATPTAGPVGANAVVLMFIVGAAGGKPPVL